MSHPPADLHPAVAAAAGFAEPLIVSADLDPAWPHMAIDLRLALVQEFLLEQEPDLVHDIGTASAAAAALSAIRKPAKRWAIFTRWVVRRLRESDLRLGIDAGPGQLGWWPNVEERPDGLAVVRFLPDRSKAPENVPFVLERDGEAWRVLYGLFRPVPGWPPSSEPLDPPAHRVAS